MSYGVIAWKAGQVQVEELERAASTCDPAPENHRAKPKAPWRPGRLTLTPLTLILAPANGRPIVVQLADVQTVEASGGRVRRIVSFRTATRALHLRALGACAFAKQVALALDARHSPSPTSRPTSS